MNKLEAANAIISAAKEGRSFYPNLQGRLEGDWLHRMIAAVDLFDVAVAQEVQEMEQRSKAIAGRSWSDYEVLRETSPITKALRVAVSADDEMA